jgi:hypothetical protein
MLSMLMLASSAVHVQVFALLVLFPRVDLLGHQANEKPSGENRMVFYYLS